MKVYGIIGWKNAGKTGLMERLVAAITARGFSVSTVKHVHHDVDLDQPGKDTFRHRIAGAREVVLASAHRFAILHEHRGPEPDLAAILARIEPVDLVLVEGYKRDAHPKIEVFRHETGQTLIQLGDPLVRAVATDVQGLTLTVPVLDLNDTEAVAEFILKETGLATRPIFDEVIIADWSASSKPATKPAANSIWLGIANVDGVEVSHFRTRHEAERFLTARLKKNKATSIRTLAGFDFAFGYPAGFATHLTGQASAPAVWSYLAKHLEDKPDNANLRFKLAGEINRRFDSPGPFWGCDKEGSVAGLNYNKAVTYGPGFLSERRTVENVTKGTKSVWQLTGAGAVGSQSLVGLPMIHRLVQATGAKVWPLDLPEGPLVIAEIYPSMLADAVNIEVGKGWFPDAAQVRLLSLALWRLSRSGRIADLLAPITSAFAAEEGWILGAGHQAVLKDALQWTA